MRVNVVDSGRRQGGVFECESHGAVGAVARVRRSGDMMGIGGATIAGKFGVDGRTAGNGVCVFFEDEHSGTFADNKTAAGSVKGAGGVLWGVVRGGGERARALESGEGKGVDAGF